MAGSELVLVLHCRDLPAAGPGGGDAVRLGVQEGREVTQDVPARGAEVTFSVTLRVTEDARTGVVRYGGPFVQGRTGDHFVYLCWLEQRGETWAQIGRAKLPLRYLDDRGVSAALRDGLPMHVFLEMTNARGGPLFATIPEQAVTFRA